MSLTASQPLYQRMEFLQRRFRPRFTFAYLGLDAVQLFNIGLLIFFFFLVNARFMLQPGLIVNLPESPFFTGATYDALTVTVTQSGLLLFDDEQVQAGELAARLAAAGAQGRHLLVEADGQVAHRTLVHIYNAAMEAGVERVILATRPSGSRVN